MKCATPACACTCSGRRARWRGVSTRCCAPLDLTQGQFSLLTSLNRPQPPSIGSVAALLAMDRTTLTANLKPLERRHLVKIAVDKEDKRGRRLVITAAGRALLSKAFPVWQKAHAETERLITGISADAMRDALRALVVVQDLRSRRSEHRR